MYDLDAIEQAAFAVLHTDRAIPTWQQIDDEFRRVAAEPHTILYLVTALKAYVTGKLLHAKQKC